MRRSLLTLVLGSLCVTSMAQATTYVRVEKDGTKTYSDRPLPGGQEIEVKPAQGYSTPTSSVSSGRPSQPDADNFSYQSCGVTPQNDATFTNPDVVTIAVVTNPGVRYSDTVILRVDGQSVGPPGTMNYQMSAPVDRGTHMISVSITDQYGKTMCTVNSSFHVMRPGVNSPANRPRPTPH